MANTIEWGKPHLNNSIGYGGSNSIGFGSVYDSSNFGQTLVDGVTLGEELLLNGDFSDSSSNWTITDSAEGIDIDVINEEVKFVTDGTGGGIQQSGVMTIGKMYQIEFDYRAVNGGIQMSPYFLTINETKRYSNVFEATTATISFYRKSSEGLTEGYIDNVSVKEVI